MLFLSSYNLKEKCYLHIYIYFDQLLNYVNWFPSTHFYCHIQCRTFGKQIIKTNISFWFILSSLSFMYEEIFSSLTNPTIYYKPLGAGLCLIYLCIPTVLNSLICTL